MRSRQRRKRQHRTPEQIQLAEKKAKLEKVKVEIELLEAEQKAEQLRKALVKREPSESVQAEGATSAPLGDDQAAATVAPVQTVPEAAASEQPPETAARTAAAS